MSILEDRGTQASLPKAQFESQETDQGRVLPFQRLLVRLLPDLPRESPPLIVDVGIGMGAPTLIDLANELVSAGIENAAIVGIDAAQIVVQTSKSLIQKARDEGKIPKGIAIQIEWGDIAQTQPQYYSITSVIERLHGQGARADLCLSANLIQGLPKYVRPTAIKSLCEASSASGLVGVGAGEADSSLKIDIVDASSGKIVQSLTAQHGESDPIRAEQLEQVRRAVTEQRYASTNELRVPRMRSLDTGSGSKNSA